MLNTRVLVDCQLGSLRKTVAIVVGTLGWGGIQSVSLAWRLNLHQSYKKKPQKTTLWKMTFCFVSLKTETEWKPLCFNVILDWLRQGLWNHHQSPTWKRMNSSAPQVQSLFLSQKIPSDRVHSETLINGWQLTANAWKKKKNSLSCFLINKAGIWFYRWKIFCLLPCSFKLNGNGQPLLRSGLLSVRMTT